MRIKKELKVDFSEAIESYALEQHIEKEIIAQALSEEIKDQLSEYFNVENDKIIVESTIDNDIKAFFLKEVISDNAHLMDETEIHLSDGKKIKKNIKIGDVIKAEIDLSQLNRRAISYAFSGLTQRLKNIHSQNIYNEFLNKKDTIAIGTVLRRDRRKLSIDLGKAEGILYINEFSSRENYVQGDKIKVYINDVILSDKSEVNIYLSRTNPNFVKKLFEIEVPELQSGAVHIKSIVREPGKKTKMSVYATKSNVEPVGACVGMTGIRIKSVMKELAGEKIDIIPVTEKIKEFLSKSIQPAKVEQVYIIDKDSKDAILVVQDDEYPLAVGKNGINIKLAMKLTGWKLRLKRLSQIEKQPNIINIFNKSEKLFNDEEYYDIEQLTTLDESTVVKLMNANIVNITELYEMKVEELVQIENITLEEAKQIRKTLDEKVEFVDNQEISYQRQQSDFENEFEDEIVGMDTKEVIEEEIQHVEYLVCPNCSFEFEYKDELSCPSCKVEFEFEEE